MKNPIYTQKSECSGFRACVEACPKQCINVVKDEDHLILYNSLKGLCLKELLNQYMNLKPVEVNWAIESNQQLKSPTLFHKNRGFFFWQFRQTRI